MKLYVFVCLGAVNPLAMAEDSRSVAKHVQGEMDKYVAAVKKKDYKAADAVILSNFSPSCKLVGTDGKTLALKAWLKENDDQLRSMKTLTSISLKLTNPVLKGTSFSGTESYAMSGTTANPKDPKKTSKISINGVAELLMQKKNGKWAVTKRTDKSVKVLIDGKPLQPAASKN
jgi:hypothetical protein